MSVVPVNTNLARPHVVVPDSDSAAEFLAGYMQASADEALAPSAGDGGATFVLGLSGGSAVTLVSRALKTVKSDFSRWRVILCDERLVDTNDGESTYGAYKRAVLNDLPILDENFVKPLFTEPNADEAAADYERKLRRMFVDGAQWPMFNLLILGVGDDGHTASLFPGHPLLDERAKWVAAITDSPKMPPRRITLTLPAINAAGRCVFLALGAGKADVIKRILVDKEELPAYLVNPRELRWVLDVGAAGKLTN